MDRDFTLATELTEDGVGGEWRIRPHASSQAGTGGAGAGLSFRSATKGGWGLLVACLLLWALYRMFPGNQRQESRAVPDNRPLSSPAAPATLPSARPQPEEIDISINERGVVITRRVPSAASSPAAEAGKATRKPNPPATQPTRDAAAALASDPQPTR